MRASILFTAVGLCVSSALAAPVSVPFVGCPSDGQIGPDPAPKGGAVAVDLPPEVAARLAFYQSKYDSGVLAPRGWHCYNLEGSNGWFTIVAPQGAPDQSLFATDKRPLTGPALQISFSYGDTSGRIEVAALIARYFPKRRAFVTKVLTESGENASNYPSGPFKTDKLVSRRPDRVEYLTPPGRDGLGTKSHLSPGDRPIHALLGLTEAGADPADVGGALVVVVRIPKDQEDLAPVILTWAERTYLGAK